MCICDYIFNVHVFSPSQSGFNYKSLRTNRLTIILDISDGITSLLLDPNLRDSLSIKERPHSKKNALAISRPFI